MVTLVVVVLAAVAGASIACALTARGRRRRDQLQSDIPLGARLRDRRAFMEELVLETARANRTGRPTCLLVAQLSGEPATTALADERADRLGELLDATLRSIDRCYRIGVNEFAMVLPETRAVGALVAVDRLARVLARDGLPAIYGGVAETGPGVESDTLFRHAYCALLAASHGESPAVLMYSPELEPTHSVPAQVHEPGAGSPV
jgi:GGDEF domain-containing protein